MRRYVDADKLKSDIKEIAKITGGNLTEFEALGVLSGQPTAYVVDGDKAQKEIDYWHDKAQSYEQTIAKLTLNQADVVEVVRCKHCKHKPNGYTDDDVLRYPNFPHEENNPCPCQVYEDKWYSWIPNDDFYCSYGERAEK